MTTAISEAEMYYYSQILFLPLMLIINFALFQYLFVTYFSRRREPRGVLLLGCAVLGFASLIPLAHPDEAVVQRLNDISEACSTLTFLVQITIVGHDTNRKVKIRALYLLTFAAEVLIATALGVIVLDIIEVFDLRIGDAISKEANQTIEDVSLAFIFVFRFYYLSLIKGVRTVLQTKQLEIFAYFLFLSHEYPFMALEASTGVTWEFVQGIYHRLLIVGCVWLTVRNKLRYGRALGNFTSATNNSRLSHGSRKNASESVGAGTKAPELRGPSMAITAAASIAPAPMLSFRPPTARL
ncbi:hypothetical protein PybrP1_012160 [[Pythium] brassicae (nom. inval.)]|nr:hypothetical protein PybrP1_012160 [[Pythium] brassicae (nom. inval.)]